MNQTNFEHAIYALLMQAAIGLITGDWWAGAAFGAAFFLGREHAQAEERYLVYHRTSRHNTPWLELRVFVSSEAWDRDALLDWIFPIVAVVVVAVAKVEGLI